MGGIGFTSTAFGSLDAKGRVCIPSAFRDALRDQNSPGLYVYQPILDIAVDCFGLDLLKFIQEKYAGTDPLYDAVENEDLKDFNANTQLLPVDGNGRVRLPDPLIAYAGLKDKVAFVGMGQKFQICTEEQFRAQDADRRARIRARMLAERAKAEARNAAGGLP